MLTGQLYTHTGIMPSLTCEQLDLPSGTRMLKGQAEATAGGVGALESGTIAACRVDAIGYDKAVRSMSSPARLPSCFRPFALAIPVGADHSRRPRGGRGNYPPHCCEPQVHGRRSRACGRRGAGAAVTL
jgi:hypothetical protein